MGIGGIRAKKKDQKHAQNVNHHIGIKREKEKEKMKKEETIRRYGEVAYEKVLQQTHDYYAQDSEQNPDKFIVRNREIHRKGGKYYEQQRKTQMVGIPHEKTLIRQKHQRIWTPFKQIIAPDSALHHEWIPETADYRGVALVEKRRHQYGCIDVIQILEGEITLFTEEEIRKDKRGF